MRRELLLLEEIAQAAERAHTLVEGTTLSHLTNDRIRQDALLWNFTVLGEATAQLPAEVKMRFPDVPWQQPIRLRNRIVHGYWSIDLEILHTTAQTQLEDFADRVRQVLAAVSTDAASDPEWQAGDE